MSSIDEFHPEGRCVRRWLKGFTAFLVAVAVVVAGSYVLRDSERLSPGQQKDERELQARIELFTFARANESEAAKVHIFCKALETKSGNALEKDVLTPLILRNCEHFGYL